MSTRKQYISYTDLVYRCETEEQNIKNNNHSNSNSINNNNDKRQKVRHVEKCLSVTYDRSPTCGSLPDLVKLKVNQQHQVDHKHPKTYLSTRSTLSNVDLRSYILYRPSSSNNTPVKGKYKQPKSHKKSSKNKHKIPQNGYLSSKIEQFKSSQRPSKHEDRPSKCDCRLLANSDEKLLKINQRSDLSSAGGFIDLCAGSPLLKRSFSQGSIPRHRVNEQTDRVPDRHIDKWRIQPINIVSVNCPKHEEKKGRLHKLFQEMKKLNIFRRRHHHAVIMSPSPDIGNGRKLERRETWSYMKVRSGHQV